MEHCRLKPVLAPAIGYAENGYPVLPRMASTIKAARAMFERYWPSSAAIYLPGGEPPRAGTLFRNRTLAQTWRRLVTVTSNASGTREDKIDAARRAWSHGFVADAIDAFCRRQQVMDVTGQRHGALLRGDDMAAWSATYEDPAVYDYGGHRFAKCGAWSQGPVLLQTLALLAGSDIDRVPPSSAAFVHLLVEAMKLAYADRELHYGDPNHVDVPLGSLLSEEYNEARRRAIGEQASMEWRPGTLGHGLPAFDYVAATARKRDEGLLAAYGGGEPTVATPAEDTYLAVAVGDTSHIDVVDRDGNMVSATPSGGWLQSSPTIPDLGFPLGTRAQTMWLDPPDMPSALAPGRRPRTTLSPTIVSRDDGDCLIACGTPGGDQQDQWQLAFLLRHIHHDMGLQQAIEAPGFHTEHWPNSFYPRQASPGKVVLEGRFAPADVRATFSGAGMMLSSATIGPKGGSRPSPGIVSARCALRPIRAGCRAMQSDDNRIVDRLAPQPGSALTGDIAVLEEIQPTNRVARALRAFEHAIAGVVTIALVALVAIIFANVVGRYIFNSSLTWAAEAAQWLFVAIIFLAIPLAHRASLHLSITYLVDKLPERSRSAVNLAGEVVVAYTTIMLLFGAKELIEAIGGTNHVLGLPAWVKYAVIPLSCIAALIFTAFRGHDQNVGRWRGPIAIAVAAVLYLAINTYGLVSIRGLEPADRDGRRLFAWHGNGHSSLLRHAVRRFHGQSGGRTAARPGGGPEHGQWVRQVPTARDPVFHHGGRLDECWRPDATIDGLRLHAGGASARRLRTGQRDVQHALWRHLGVELFGSCPWHQGSGPANGATRIQRTVVVCRDRRIRGDAQHHPAVDRAANFGSGVEFVCGRLVARRGRARHSYRRVADACGLRRGAGPGSRHGDRAGGRPEAGQRTGPCLPCAAARGCHSWRHPLRCGYPDRGRCPGADLCVVARHGRISRLRSSRAVEDTPDVGNRSGHDWPVDRGCRAVRFRAGHTAGPTVGHRVRDRLVERSADRAADRQSGAPVLWHVSRYRGGHSYPDAAAHAADGPAWASIRSTLV